MPFAGRDAHRPVSRQSPRPSPGESVTLEEMERRRNQVIPIGRANDPEDIAAMAVFLASPGARNITGQSFNVDGGLIPD